MEDREDRSLEEQDGGRGRPRHPPRRPLDLRRGRVERDDDGGGREEEEAEEGGRGRAVRRRLLPQGSGEEEEEGDDGDDDDSGEENGGAEDDTEDEVDEEEEDDDDNGDDDDDDAEENRSISSGGSDDTFLSGYDSDYGFDEDMGLFDEEFDERGGALAAELKERRPCSSSGQGLSWLAEGTADLVRRHGGGDGSVLWRRVLSREDQRTLFQACCETLSLEEMSGLLRRLVSFLPGLMSRRDYERDHYGRIPPRQEDEYYHHRDIRIRGTTLLHLAVRSRAPLETIRLVARMTPGALLLRDRRGRRPVHDACSRHYHPGLLDLPRIMAVVDAGRDALRTTTRRGELPLHLAAQHLMTGGPRALKAIQWLIDAHPEALNSRTRFGLTPVMIAIHNADQEARPDPWAIDLLLHMIKLAPESMRSPNGLRAQTVLHLACGRCPYMELVSPLVEACRDALSIRSWRSEAVPLYMACYWLLESARSDHAQEVIRFLMNAYPDALRTKDCAGTAPIMHALYHWRRGVEPSPDALQLLLDMIKEGGPRSLATRLDHFAQAVEICVRFQYPWNLELASLLMEVHPAALCICLGECGVRGSELADTMVPVMCATFWAAVEVLLHETTRGIVPDPVQARVRQALGCHVPPDVIRNGSSLALARSLRDCVHGDDLWRLRSRVLDDKALKQFLRSSEDFQDLISGVYRMNRAGRLGGTEGGGAAAPDAARGTLDQHVRILAAAGDNLSCLFLRLRESPALFGIHEPAEAASNPNADARE